jgi:hypothetical protein
MGQIQITISLVLIALFAVAILSFAVHFATDNNAPVSIANDPQLSSLQTNTKGNVSGFSSDAQNQYQSIIQTTIAPGSQTAPSAGPFAITPTNALGASKNIIQVGWEKITGGDTGFGIFFTALVGMIIFMIGLYIYKTLRGFPD